MTRPVMVSILVAAAALAGCRRASEFDGRHYRHNGMHFALEVPAGWTHEELPGDVLLELRGPAPTSADGLKSREAALGVRPMVHVFSRREEAAVDLDRVARELQALMLEERRFDPAQAQAAPEATAAAVKSETGEVRGLPARRFERTVHEGAAVIHQKLLVLAKGDQAWALLVSVPEASRESSAAAVEQIEKSFEVW